MVDDHTFQRRYYLATDNMRQRGYKRPRQGMYYGQHIGGQGGFWSSVGDGLGAMGKNIKRKFSKPGTFSGLGAAFGGAVGGKPGAGIGAAAGNLFSKLVGFGEYNVAVNSLMPGQKLDEGSGIPIFGELKHATIISHREFIGNVTAPTANTTFTNTTYPLNVGLEGTFPWLSNIAKNYDQYQILGMVVEYRSTSSDVSTSSALGSVILATEYDVSHSAYSSKLEMANSQYSMSGAPTQHIIHPIECDPKLHSNALLNIRYDDVSTDKRWYDWANFQIATEGLAASGGEIIGELYVSYQVALYKPSLPAAYGLSRRWVYKLNTVSAASAYMGTTQTASVVNPTESIVSFSANQFTISAAASIAGDYYTVVYIVRGASTALTNALSLDIDNCTVTNDVLGTWNADQIEAGETTTTQMMVAQIKVTASNVETSFGFDAGTLPGTITSSHLMIIPQESFA